MLRPENSNPFFFQRGKVGVVLVHGFTGSPWEMRPVGEYLASRDISVSCKLLPGHGHADRDLNSIPWRAWVETVDATYTELAKICDSVFVAGLSMGGVLALHLAAHRPVAGVATYSAFLKPADWRAPLVDLIKYVRPFDPKGELDIKNPQARMEWAGYSTYPAYGASQMLKLCRHLVDDLPDVRCPALLMHGRADHTVKFSQMAELAKRMGSKDIQQIPLENSYHVVTVDNDKENVQRETHAFITRVLSS